MPEIGMLEDILDRNGKVTDYTCLGKCSNCDNCCNDVLPLTNGDINRIKQYIKKNNIKPINHALRILSIRNIDVMCPFRNEEEKKCNIYEVRPLVCKRFSCHDYHKTLYANYHDLADKTKQYSMRNTFFGKKNYEK